MGKLYLGDQEIGVYQMEKAEEPLMKYTVDANGKISKGGDAFVLPSNVKDLGPYVFYYACERGTVTSADLSSLTSISGDHAAYWMFSGCTNLTSVDLSSLVTITGNTGACGMFNSCTNLVSADLSSLATINGSYAAQTMFNGCTNLTSVDLSSLSTIIGSSSASGMFQNCKNLREVRFPALTANSFGTSTNQISNLVYGVTGCTLHFPASTQAKIEKMSGYPNFGGINTTVLFDL